uniref:Uncharacterized protein n=1 Tax=Candidatus Kentrum sp. DK TaxID=2126562 RepID=A0A450RZZ5_9GAMM|nr:MAG: hypothetical protein BECKDK2373C_GA0170839_100930 [Candidatus Kentron sp. DK]
MDMDLFVGAALLWSSYRPKCLQSRSRAGTFGNSRTFFTVSYIRTETSTSPTFRDTSIPTSLG